MSEKKQCMKCSANPADYDLRYFAVEVHVNSQVRGNQRITTTTEQMRGVDKYYVCDRCFQERRLKYSRNGALIALIATLVVGGGLGCAIFRSSIPVVLIVAAVAAVALAVWTYRSDLQKSPEEIGAVMLKESKPKKEFASINFYSAHRERYYTRKTGAAFTEATFRTQTQLKTKIGSILYEIISRGLGDEIVDQVIASQNSSDASAQIDNDHLEHIVNLKKEKK